jgi:hypothetical protein
MKPGCRGSLASTLAVGKETYERRTGAVGPFCEVAQSRAGQLGKRGRQSPDLGKLGMTLRDVSEYQ